MRPSLPQCWLSNLLAPCHPCYIFTGLTDDSIFADLNVVQNVQSAALSCMNV